MKLKGLTDDELILETRTSIEVETSATSKVILSRNL
jgi:hypothetical protein